MRLCDRELVVSKWIGKSYVKCSGRIALQIYEGGTKMDVLASIHISLAKT